MYSFIAPKPKTIVKTLTKVWGAYIMLAVLCVFLFDAALALQAAQSRHAQREVEQQMHTNDIKIIALNDYIDRLSYEAKIARNAQLQNRLSVEGVKNLFDLIPDQITAKSVKIQDNELIIEGITPSKEVYKFLLEAPLRAVFTQSRVEFFPLSSGWYNFVSVSKTDITTREVGASTSAGANAGADK